MDIPTKFLLTLNIVYHSIEYISKKKVRLNMTHFLFFDVVDLVGVEPTSEQGNHTLSTCLF